MNNRLVNINHGFSMRHRFVLLLPLMALSLTACEGDAGDDAAGIDGEPAAAALPPCDADNGGLQLPAGFCATVVAENLGRARHIAVAPNGDLYVATYAPRGSDGEGGGVIALRDTTGDGKADVRATFGPSGGSGLYLQDGNLFFAPDDAVLRWRLAGGELAPVGPADTVVAGLPDEHSHRAKTVVATGDGALFVNIGSPTNACQPLGQDRQIGVQGEDSCTQLETRAGVWRFDATRTGQTAADGERFATGIRNAVGLALGPDGQTLYATQHGRDQLGQWEGYSEEDNAEKPAEELLRLTQGTDAGWPYCYYDPAQNIKVLAPEYGGNGQEVGRCASAAMPVATMPAHWAPNALVFYNAGQFPERYQGGAFIAYHGSWNRAPLPQAGYNVVFVPFAGAEASDYEVFADGFTGPNPQPGDATHRPTGLAVGPDGSLYISDDAGGRIWRVMYSSR